MQRNKVYALLAVCSLSCAENCDDPTEPEDGPRVRVSIQRGGTGLGNVRSTISLIDCNFTATGQTGRCEEFFTVTGSGSVRLLATPDISTIFGGWQCSRSAGGECSQCQGTGECLLTYNVAGSEVSFGVTATFNPAPPPPPPPASCDVGLALHDAFDDGAAPTARWTSELFAPFTDGTRSRTEVHSTSGGNPDGFRRLTHTVGPPAGASNLSSIWVAHFYTAGSYTPSATGSIARVVYQEDQRVFSALPVGWAFAVRQGGQIYVAQPAGAVPIATTTWTSRGPYDITPASFGTNRPDFTDAGGPMEFGFLRHNSTEANPTSGFTTEHGIDNWRVWVCKGPPPGVPVAVFQDDFNDITDPLVRWDTTYTRTGGGTATLDNPGTGALPPAEGGYRRGRHEFPTAGFVSVTHLFKTPFDPAPGGPITRLDVSMDRLMDPASTPGSGVGSAFVVSQGGVTYTASLEANNVFSNTTWQRVTKSLTAADFSPAPGPNFSAGVMRFGIIRGNTSGAGVTVIWGTDNWRVEVWR